MVDAFAEAELCCERLLREGTKTSLLQAEDAAQTCLELDRSHVRGYLLLATTLSRLRRHDEAVNCYKKGLEVHPENVELQTGLKEARVAVLNSLLEESEEEEDEDNSVLAGDQRSQHTTESRYVDRVSEMQLTQEGDTLRSTEIVQRAQTYASSAVDEALVKKSEESTVHTNRIIQTTVFQAKMERILEHLDVQKLARLAAVYIFSELLNLRRVRFGIVLFFLGLLAQAILHRQKIMVVSMLAICLYQSQLRDRAFRFAQEWVRTSTDKLGAFTWTPRIIFVVPVFMKVFGQLKFMVFLQQDLYLAGVVLAVTSMLVVNAFRSEAGQESKLWGEGRRLKFAAYFTAFAYWVGWRGELADSMRLLAPAFIDAGGIVLGTISSSELQAVCQRAFKRIYGEVASDIQADVDLDAWFFLCLSNWVVEYWQQPTDFSLEMLSKMLSECFDTMEKAAVRTFSPELRRLREQIKEMEISDELQLLVAYLKQSSEAVPPPRPLGMAALISKWCPSFVVFALLVVFYGVISLPSLPFVVAEATGARGLYDLYHDGKLQEMDGLELMLLGSPLFRVWKNAKGCIYCLEGSVTFSKAVATGTHIVSAAARISRLAMFASRVKNEGLFSNAHDIPDHIANAFLVTKDSSLIVDGVRYMRESPQFQDLQASITKWWYGEHTR
ncbi:hypothetical protein PHYBOEH_007399 [Phytophthora boehmeriae]|uniref:Uncharacterized protein n=1 Tax=Phytophthora boehmeriae TaxID=109152 RepID=A0A8T1W823_9STRA|nr:hypothetical protein PHYBOEH_007399 [Phytophthora boehmeriae]